MCPHGIVYLPNVCIYDYARGLVAHTNHRRPHCPPFQPHDGCVQEPSAENIQKARAGTLKIAFPWLLHKKELPDLDCHPVTGCSEHYALSDVFHESNSRDERDVLRKIRLVPELSGRINSQCAEQLFCGMKRNKYYMNLLSPTSHVFLYRNILHHTNASKKKEVVEQFKKLTAAQELLFELQSDKRGIFIVNFG